MFRRKFKFFKHENPESHYPNFQFILWRHIMGDNIPFPPSYCSDEQMYWKELFKEFDDDSMGNELELYDTTSYNLNKPYLKTLLDWNTYHISRESIPEEVVHYNQDILRRRFGESVELYHGTKNHKSFKKFAKTHETIWTDSLGVAKMHQGKGTIVKAVVPIDKILLSHYGSALLDSGQEYEFIIERGITI
jgi:hypothetical protein